MLSLKNTGWLFGLVLLIASCAKPVANFSIEDYEPSAPAKITFNNSSEKADTYQWDFGDGNISTEASPSHSYFKPGQYTVILNASKEGKTHKKETTINIEPPEQCLVEMTTSKGNIIILLFNETPYHRDNFLKLTEEGFYNNQLFHRVINGFMIQSGDPNSRKAKANTRLGGGGPGYTIPAEFNSDFVHLKGILAAARQPDEVNPEKESSGSQFYIVQGTKVTDAQLDQFERSGGFKYTPKQRESYKQLGGAPQLDGEYTIFGQVLSGMEVIDEIARTETDRTKGDRPKEDIKITITVIK